MPGTTFTLNGVVRTLTTDPNRRLLWVIRDDLGLTGTKFGCGIAACGACTVLVDGQPKRACATPISSVGGARITTIESLDGDRVGRAVQEAWVRNDVVQCGYCQSGQVVAATALLTAKKNPSDRDI